MSMNRWLCFLTCLVFCGCEGATRVQYHFENSTSDTVKLLFRGHNTWVDSTAVDIPPAGTQTLWAVDQRGKCNECAHYGSPYTYMDTLDLLEGQWLNYPRPEDWFSHSNEGRSWIEFDHRLTITPEMIIR